MTTNKSSSKTLTDSASKKTAKSNKLSDETYNFIDKIQQESLAYCPLNPLATKGLYAILDNATMDCYIHNNVPVKIEQIKLHSIESIIEQFRAYDALALPGVCIDRNQMTTATDVAVSDQQQLFELASRTYKRTLFGKKIIDPAVNIEYNGYVAEMDFSNMNPLNIKYENGKAYPQKMIVHHKEKTLKELTTRLQEAYANINARVEKEFPHIMSKEYDPEHTSSSAQICNSMSTKTERWSCATQVRTGKTIKTQHTIEQEIPLLSFRKNCKEYYWMDQFLYIMPIGELAIPLGTVTYAPIAPDGKTLTATDFKKYVAQKQEKTINAMEAKHAQEFKTLNEAYEKKHRA